MLPKEYYLIPNNPLSPSFKHITLCEFKVYNMLAWFTCVLQHDYHYSVSWHLHHYLRVGKIKKRHCAERKKKRHFLKSSKKCEFNKCALEWHPFIQGLIKILYSLINNMSRFNVPRWQVLSHMPVAFSPPIDFCAYQESKYLFPNLFASCLLLYLHNVIKCLANLWNVNEKISILFISKLSI